MLPATFQPPFDLASTPQGLAGGTGLSGDVVFVQTLELAVAFVDQVSADRNRMATVGRTDTPPTRQISAAT